MFELLKRKATELKWFLKKHRKPSLFDLNYTLTEDPSGKPFATPERIAEYIKLGADINEVRMGELGSEWPLTLADESKNYEAIASLWKHGVGDHISDKWLDSLIEDPGNEAIKKDLLSYRRKRMGDALLRLDYKSATKADIDKLIEKGADVNAWNKEGGKEKTPVYFAMRSGNYDAFRQLVERGANLTILPDGSPLSDVARYVVMSHVAHENSRKVLDWFEANKKFIQDIETERATWSKYDPVPMQRSEGSVGLTSATTQNYSGKMRTYLWDDYEAKRTLKKEGKQTNNMISPVQRKER